MAANLTCWVAEVFMVILNNRFVSKLLVWNDENELSFPGLLHPYIVEMCVDLTVRCW